MMVLFNAGGWVWEGLRRLFLEKCPASLDLEDKEELPQGRGVLGRENCLYRGPEMLCL